MDAIHGCAGCATTAGAGACPVHGTIGTSLGRAAVPNYGRLEMSCEIESLRNKLSAALLQIDDWRKTLADLALHNCCDEACFGPCSTKRAADALAKYANKPKCDVCNCSAGESCDVCRALGHITEKRKVSPQKKCDSYWDGNQCEANLNHEGKHRFMGWTWVVSPPPMLCNPCSAHDRAKDPGCLCPCHKPKVD